MINYCSCINTQFYSQWLACENPEYIIVHTKIFSFLTSILQPSLLSIQMLLYCTFSLHSISFIDIHIFLSSIHAFHRLCRHFRAPVSCTRSCIKWWTCRENISITDSSGAKCAWPSTFQHYCKESTLIRNTQRLSSLVFPVVPHSSPVCWNIMSF